MKINKELGVKIGDRIYSGQEILRITIDGTRFDMVYGFNTGSEITIKCHSKDVEFVSIPQIPILARGGVIGRDRTHTYYEHTYKVGDEPASDIEIVSPPEKLKNAFNEAIKEMGEKSKTIQVGLTIEGKQFVNAIKPGDAIRNSGRKPLRKETDNLNGAGFFDLTVKRIEEDNKVRKVIKEVVREVMTEDASEHRLAKKVKLEIDPDAFAKLMKKYKRDQARWSGGD